MFATELFCRNIGLDAPSILAGEDKIIKYLHRGRGRCKCCGRNDLTYWFAESDKTGGSGGFTEWFLFVNSTERLLCPWCVAAFHITKRSSFLKPFFDAFKENHGGVSLQRGSFVWTEKKGTLVVPPKRDEAIEAWIVMPEFLADAGHFAIVTNRKLSGDFGDQRKPRIPFMRTSNSLRDTHICLCGSYPIRADLIVIAELLKKDTPSEFHRHPVERIAIQAVLGGVSFRSKKKSPKKGERKTK
jgi:hypothetical protein